MYYGNTHSSGGNKCCGTNVPVCSKLCPNRYITEREDQDSMTNKGAKWIEHQRRILQTLLRCTLIHADLLKKGLLKGSIS